MARKPQSDDAAAKPTLMTGRKPAVLRFDEFIKIVDLLTEPEKKDLLLALCEKDDLKVSVPVRTVNKIKRFVAAHAELRDHPVGAMIMHPVERPKRQAGALVASAEDPFNTCCGFGSGR